MNRHIHRLLLCWVLLLASGSGFAATFDFDGGAVSGCSLNTSSKTYTCASSPSSAGQSVFVKKDYTVNANLVAAAVTLDQDATIVGNVSGTVVELQQHARITGNIVASTSLSLDQNTAVTGDVQAPQVTLKQNSTLTGDVAATTVTVEQNGRLTGNVTATTLTMKQNADVVGDVTATTITLDQNATLTGNATTAGVTLENNAIVSEMIYCTTNLSVVCGCVTNRSGNAINQVSGGGPTCQAAAPPPPPPSCVVDDLSSGTLDGSLWNPLAISGSFTPTVVGNRIRMTTASGNQSTMLQLKKWFPGAGNKITVEFDYYVYGGNGADGMTVVFSDASVSPAPGGFGGSLGYAQRDGTVNGFSGGWLAVGIDEYGNFPTNGEGRSGYPSGWTAPAPANVGTGFYANNISVRGSGSGTTGYALLANTGTLSTPIWRSSNTSSTRQRFRISIDHTDNVHAYVTLERDYNASGSYTTLVPRFDAKAAPGQAAVPQNWLVSFTGSTGGSNNIHEIALLSICARYINPPGGSTDASAFDCLETGANSTWSASARKPLYTKLANTNFKFDIAALKADGTLEGNYVAAGGNSKYVKVELFDDATPAASCAAYANPVASQNVTFASGSISGAAGRVLSGDFNLPAAYSKLRCRVRECSTSACASFSAVLGCSTDDFAVRPSEVTLAAANAAPSAPSAPVSPLAGTAPWVRAGAAFTVRASTSGTYSGTLNLDTGKLSAQTTVQDATVQSGGVVGALTPAALTANAAAVNATYSEVGYLYLGPGAYIDTSLTAIDRANGDCISDITGGGNLSVTPVGGKYGCDVGNAATYSFGRFIPDHFAVTAPVLSNRAAAACAPASAFTYMGEVMSLGFTLEARSAGDVITQNYTGIFARLNPINAAALGVGAIDASTPRVPFTACVPGAPIDPCFTLGALPAAPDPAAPIFVNGAVNIANLAVTANRGAAPIGPLPNFQLGIAPQDADGVMTVPDMDALNVVAVPGVVNRTRVGAATALRYGRMKIDNAYGSDLLNLPVATSAQFWNGAAFVDNRLDSCTALPAGNFQLVNPSGNIGGKTGLTAGSVSVQNLGPVPVLRFGAGRVVLTRPISPLQVKGSVTLRSTLSYLPGDGRETFGISRAGPIIFLREVY